MVNKEERPIPCLLGINYLMENTQFKQMIIKHSQNRRVNEGMSLKRGAMVSLRLLSWAAG